MKAEQSTKDKAINFKKINNMSLSLYTYKSQRSDKTKKHNLCSKGVITCVNIILDGKYINQITKNTLSCKANLRLTVSFLSVLFPISLPIPACAR